MFFDIFSMLCAEKGVSRYAAATAIGKNRSAVAKWKTGAVPNGSTLALLASYFDVTTDFLLGGTPDAYFRWTQYKLNQAEAEYESETDQNKKQEIASLIEGLRVSLSDQGLDASVSNFQQRNKTDAERDGLETLLDQERVLLHGFRSMSEDDKQLVLSMIRRIKSDAD